MEEPSDHPTRSVLFGKSKSRSFPRTLHEATAFDATNSSDLNAPLLHSLAYTSLKDLMPASHRQKCRFSPPKGSVVHESAYEIPITNMLVQKAAWAYLQPMPEVNNPESRFFSIFGRLKVFSSRIVWAIRYVLHRVLGAYHHEGVEVNAN